MKKNEIAIQQQSPTPTTLLEKAIERGVDMAQLKELMDLQERWEKKEAKKKFFEALSAFQSMVPVLKKTKVANMGTFTYKYSDLGSITSQIKTPLYKCGLSYRFEFKENAGKLEVTCLVSHKDGHTETTVMEAGPDTSGAKNAVQQKGSTHTYLQRYTLIGALGLSTADEDNDGKGNTTPKKQEQKGLTEEEILQQWTDVTGQVKTRLELTALYLKNRKAVDGSEKIKAIFKSRESALPETKKATVLP
jgi:hypothetical protein